MIKSVHHQASCQVSQFYGFQSWYEASEGVSKHIDLSLWRETGKAYTQGVSTHESREITERIKCPQWTA